MASFSIVAGTQVGGAIGSYIGAATGLGLVPVPVGTIAPRPVSGTLSVETVASIVFGTADHRLRFELSDNGAPAASDAFCTLVFTDKDGVIHTLARDSSLNPNGAFGGTATEWIWITSATASAELFTSGNTYDFTLLTPDDFNCDCETVSPYDTLANVRTRMLIRLGYPNQVSNPPPGMASLIDEFLRSAQREIYRQVQRAARRTERFYRWTMVPGQRYYGLQDNDNCCLATLDPEKVTWVGFEDLNQAWYRLDDGIPPEYYTRANISFGWPTRYEIRSCIEIFPAPQAAYSLWVKGDFGLSPLVADTDRFTIDDEAVFLLALGNAKAHYGQKDAQLVLAQAGNYMKGVVAGAHGTKRYVPRSETENPLTPPKFLPLGSDQA